MQEYVFRRNGECILFGYYEFNKTLNVLKRFKTMSFSDAFNMSGIKQSLKKQPYRIILENITDDTPVSEVHTFILLREFQEITVFYCSNYFNVEDEDGFCRYDNSFPTPSFQQALKEYDYMYEVEVLKNRVIFENTGKVISWLPRYGVKEIE